MANSKAERAIIIFSKHKAKLQTSNISQWLSYAADLTDIYIGPETQLRKDWYGLIYHENSNLPQKASGLIDLCIESIRDNGVYQGNNKNFLQRWGNTELMALLVAVLLAAMGLTWGLGVSIGQFRIDKLNEEVFRLESELKKSQTLKVQAIQQAEAWKREATRQAVLAKQNSSPRITPKKAAK